MRLSWCLIDNYGSVGLYVAFGLRRHTLALFLAARLPQNAAVCVIILYYHFSSASLAYEQNISCLCFVNLPIKL